MFPHAIRPEFFRRHHVNLPTMQLSATGCEQCGTDWGKHNVHMLEEKRRINTNLAYGISAFAESVFMIHIDDAKTLGSQIESFLNYPIEQELAQLRANPPDNTPLPPMFSTVDLMRAAEKLAKLETERERYQESIDKMPEEMRGMMQAAGGILFSVLDSQIERAQEELSMIQQALEEAQPVPAADSAATGMDGGQNA